MKQRLLALVCVAVPLVAAARLARPARDPLPAHTRAGMLVPVLADAARPLAKKFPAARISVVFLSRNCGVCRAVVADLAGKRSVPARGHAVLFVTDFTWPALDALEGSAVPIVHGDAMYARAVGLRATPTVIELQRPRLDVIAMEIGAPAVRSRFTGSP